MRKMKKTLGKNGSYPGCVEVKDVDCRLLIWKLISIGKSEGTRFRNISSHFLDVFVCTSKIIQKFKKYFFIYSTRAGGLLVGKSCPPTPWQFFFSLPLTPWITCKFTVDKNSTYALTESLILVVGEPCEWGCIRIWSCIFELLLFSFFFGVCFLFLGKQIWSTVVIAHFMWGNKFLYPNCLFFSEI